MNNGIFEEFFSPKKEKSLVILSPVEGEIVAMSEVSDPTFGEEILGKGVAIKPTRGRVVSPVNGTVAMMFDTGHAVSLVSEDGIEVLVHVGLDTIKLKGEHYRKLVENDAVVKAGDPLIEFSLEAIQAAGYDTIIPVVICNTDAFSSVESIVGKTVHELDEIIHLLH